MSGFEHQLLTPDKKADPEKLQLFGPTLPVELGIPPDLASYLVHTNEPVPHPVEGRALIDTGASMSCIDQEVLKRLNLKPFSAMNIATPNSVTLQGAYAVAVRFPGTGINPIPMTRCVAADLTQQKKPPFNTIALIGRDILKDCVLVYDGKAGRFKLSH